MIARASAVATTRPGPAARAERAQHTARLAPDRIAAGELGALLAASLEKRSWVSASFHLTKAALQALADRGIRANGVAPGPIWTPLTPSTMPEEAIESFGQQAPLERPGQPAELAPIYVMLASDEVSYVSGAIVPATGGRPML